ncbi:hypothetical protein G3435_26495 [Pseudomonas sp. MAFF212428]|uniref:Uncharacterized protein n=1 Tax=Pseudomonas brassicae TaxID=2708063 RepID=A0A6M0D3T2_9PSED|nr:hypothetical protein [Pseudomonas brassicae]
MTIADIKEISTLIAAAVAAGATLIAVLLTSFIQLLKPRKLNNQTQNRQKTKELKLERIEELYLLFDKWQIKFL